MHCATFDGLLLAYGNQGHPNKVLLCTANIHNLNVFGDFLMKKEAGIFLEVQFSLPTLYLK